MVSLTRMQIFEVMQEVPPVKQICHVQDYILQKLGIVDCSPQAQAHLKNHIKLFIHKINARKLKNRKGLNAFILKSKAWLGKRFEIPRSVFSCSHNRIGDSNSSSSSSVGRSKISFVDASERTKRRKCAELMSSHSAEELISAGCKKLHKDGNSEVAKSFAKAVSAKQVPEHVNSNIRPYTDEEALSFFVEGKLTKFQYKLIRLQAKERGADLYPSYHHILEAKKRCYPNHISISDQFMGVPLQSLLDHTTTRLIEVCKSVLCSVNPSSLANVELIVKWGFDGSSGQSQYKQRSHIEYKDSDLFNTWIVPLQLQTISETKQPLILWKNPHPSSVRYCRPVRLQFLKETQNVIKTEREYIEAQINRLDPFRISSPIKLEIRYRLILTMADGKVWSALIDSSSQICYICKASPKEMNNLDLIRNRTVNKETLTFGISPLHSWIGCFECLLHISYRIDIKKWRIINGDDKQIFEIRKKAVQTEFKKKIGLIIDVPKQGTDTTNDGNTSRRFFEDPKLSSEITGIDEKLIIRFAIILKAISCGFTIDIEKFNKYCYETAKLYVHLYDWYPMPASVHKILMHGSMIVSTAILPIGLLSEEAQEARNKYIREHNTRKCSRTATNEDLFKKLLTSDPLITSLRKEQPRKSGSYPPKMVELLLVPKNPNDSTISSDESDENVDY